MFKSMKRIIKWAGKYKGRLYLGSVFSFFSSLSTAIPTMAAAYALDKAIAAYWAGNTIESSLIWQTLWIIVGSIALNFLLSYLRAVLQESIGYEVAAGQRIHLGDVLKRVPLGYFSKNSVGDILTGVTTELSTLELQGMKMVDIIINGYAKFIAILLCFLFLSPAAAVISVVGVAFSSLALHGISRHSEKTAAITHQAMEDMSGSAIEYIRGLSIVKSFGQEGASIESFRKANTDLKNIHIKVEKGYTPFNCLHLFSLKLASMGIVFICAWQTLNGQMSLAAMETAGNKEFDEDTEKKGLGTPATRAGIIEKLIYSQYATRKGKQILPTDDGKVLVEILPDFLKSASMTAEWENQLLLMEHGEIAPEQFMTGIKNMLTMMLNGCDAISEEETRRFQTRESIGTCPVCGSLVYESKTNFYCSNHDCHFALWKDNRYLQSMEKTMDKKMAAELLKNGSVHVKDLYSRKKNMYFEADLHMDADETGKVNFSLSFPKKKPKNKSKKK